MARAAGNELRASPSGERGPSGGTGASAREARHAVRALAWLGFGVALGSAVALARATLPDPAPPGPVAVWVTDRDGHELAGLDADLLVAHSRAVPWPLEVEPTRDGGLWLLRSANGQATSSVRLERSDASGSVQTTLYLEQGEDLEVLDGEDALLLSRVGTIVRVLRVRPEGSWFVLHQGTDVTCAIASRGSVLVGTSAGRVLRVDPTSLAVLDDLQLEDGAALTDLEPGPTSGTAWALDGHGTSRVFLLGEDLTVRWATGLGFGARHLAGVPSAERVWVGDVASGRLVRLGANGVVELDAQGLPATGIDRVVPWRKGGALVVTPGAVLHVGAQGTLAPGQGGFAWLSDAARAR